MPTPLRVSAVIASLMSSTTTDAALAAIGAAAASHTHAMSQVTGLVDALAGKETAGAAAAALVSANNYTDALGVSVASSLSGKSPTAGNAGLVTVGTITTGTWQGTAIADTYIASAATWNAKQNALTAASQAEMEAGTEAAIRSMSPLHVKQAITALAGPAGTKTLCRWIATEKGQPPASGFATLDTQNSVPYLAFADAVTSSIVFQDWIPQGANLASGVDVTLTWAGSATSGGVRCDVAFEAMTTAISFDSFDTATAGTATTGASAWVPFSVTIRCTALDSLAAGGLFRVLVRRLGADGADTYAATAGLLAVKIDQVA